MTVNLESTLKTVQEVHPSDSAENNITTKQLTREISLSLDLGEATMPAGGIVHKTSLAPMLEVPWPPAAGARLLPLRRG
jgi:hypothetical protein